MNLDLVVAGNAKQREVDIGANHGQRRLRRSKLETSDEDAVRRGKII